MTITDLTVAAPVVHKGVTYAPGGNPHSVSDQIGAYLKYMFPDLVACTVPGGTKGLLMATTRIDGGVSRGAGQSYSSVDNALALALLEKGDATEQSSGLTQSVEMVQVNGAGLDWITPPSITTFPWARGCWIFLPVAETPSLNQREFFQAYSDTDLGNGTFLQTRHATSGATKIKILAERKAIGGSTAYQPDNDENDIRGTWAWIHEEHHAEDDVRIYVNGVEDGFVGEISRNYFSSGPLSTHIFAGKFAPELPPLGYYSCPYIYVDRVPSTDVLAELALYTPHTVSDPPDVVNLLNGDLTSAVGGSAMQERVADCVTFVNSAPPISNRVALSGTINITSTSVSTQTDMPFTFGVQVPPDALSSGERLVLKDGPTTLAIGEDLHATDEGGSIRNVVLSGILPSLNAAQTKALTVTKESGSPASGTAISTADILATDYDVEITCTIGGTDYVTTARDILAASGTWAVSGETLHGKWRDNPYCTEYIGSGCLIASGPTAHSHLRAWLHIAAFKVGSGAVGGGNPIVAIRTDVIIENGYQFVASPADVTYNYDVTVTDGSPASVVSRSAFVHPYAQRYRDRVWWGTEPEYFALPDWDYQISTQMIPNYTWDSSDFTALTTTTLDTDDEPFDSNVSAENSRGVLHSMGTTGDRAEIGLFHENHLKGLAQGNETGYRWIVENGEVGSWIAHHWRDEADGAFIKPGSEGTTPANWTGVDGASNVNLINAPGSTASPWELDTAHWPCLPYIPYMITGDLLFAEELGFDAQYVWAAGSVTAFETTQDYPGTDFANGWRRSWVWGSQERANAWQARNVGFASALYPDTTPSGIALFGSQSDLRAWLEDGYQRVCEDTVDDTSADGNIETGKKWVGDDAIRYFRGSGSTGGTEYTASLVRYNQYQTNYHNMMVSQLGSAGFNVLQTDGAAFRDWILKGVVSICNFSGGAMVDQLIQAYKSVAWSGSRGDGIETDPRISNIFYNQSQCIAAVRTDSWYIPIIGNVTLSGTDGASLSFSSDDTEFLGTLSHYAGTYVVERDGGDDYAAGGRAIITGTPSDDASCTIDTTYTEKDDTVASQFIGNAFTKTSFGPGELYIAMPDDQYGTKGSNEFDGSDDTIHTLARAAVASAKDAGLSGADAAWTYMSALSVTRLGSAIAEPKFHYDPR